MKNKLAKLEYLPNNFKILEEGDYTKEYYWITFRLAKSF